MNETWERMFVIFLALFEADCMAVMRDANSEATDYIASRNQFRIPQKLIGISYKYTDTTTTATSIPTITTLNTAHHYNRYKSFNYYC